MLTVRKCREKNQTEQYGKKIWSLLLDIMHISIELNRINSVDHTIAGSDPDHSMKLERCEREAKKAEDIFWKFVTSLLQAKGEEKFPPGPVGPVGEYAVHICFLLGLSKIGMQLVEKYYNTKHLINIEYQDDLQKYKDVLTGKKFFDCGLYTGETILHIAIVTCDTKTVEFLLNKGASLYSRARGVFFMPQWIPREKNQSSLKKLRSKLLSFATSEINKYRNEYSQVDRSCPLVDALAAFI
jgi:hypothetical protein